jgi:hypothetical protein
MKVARSAEERASWLLDQMRETPMRRGALARGAAQLKREIGRIIATQGVPATLAQRVAFQLVFKFPRRDLYGEPEWRAIGDILRREIAYLRHELSMSEPRIATALPKLSGAQVGEFLDELVRTDRKIARTILHAALSTSEPIATGRRYLAEYRLVARELRSLDPTMARTVAAASFSAGMPLSKAMEHLERFSALLKKYQDRPQLARRLARAGFRVKDMEA